MATFQLDREGGAEVLKMLAAAEVAALAAQVAAAAGAEATTQTKQSKTRFVATVKVPALAQAKDGVLSRAAAQVGLGVQRYPKDLPQRGRTATSSTGRKRGRPRKKK